MSVATFRGVVENGQVRLASDVRLPESATVYVVVPDAEAEPMRPKFDLAEMIARMPSTGRLSIRNYPADGQERTMPLGFGIYRR